MVKSIFDLGEQIQNLIGYDEPLSPKISVEKPDMEMRASGSPTNVEAFVDSQVNMKTKTNAPQLPQNFARRDLARLMNTMVVVVTSEKVQTVPQFHVISETGIIALKGSDQEVICPRQQLTLHLAMIPEDSTESTLTQEFRKFGTITSINICQTSSLLSSGIRLRYAFVSFATEKQALHAKQTLNEDKNSFWYCKIQFAKRPFGTIKNLIVDSQFRHAIVTFKYKCDAEEAVRVLADEKSLIASYTHQKSTCLIYAHQKSKSSTQALVDDIKIEM
ncbi:hypothetical protein GUITHDRAFT_106649 [Guillardia theta CCMP2712]|uniref:RRM domain-containing protein n=1 Tax=Guillardia theta (strain CCMP2712) TaxID=905079 RepID=L1JHT6_GUITC|nr:hypothetical protein GUITHDRAFT_106649 [Guillardia theta CCMP2712]EKX47660.1 hypothetical protein GUITHDRAFT_106649 [Guillardia theta CCMP2712]|eukprot:XP_005834640.1 hypothetical protein GUITHDRAFT_106649 [Guillardia theta CCMP2712]